MGHWSYHDKDALSHRCKHLRRQYNEKCNHWYYVYDCYIQSCIFNICCSLSCILMLRHIEINLFLVVTDNCCIQWRGFWWRCNADFDSEDPNLMIGMFLVSALRAFPNNSRTLLSAYIASIVLYVLFLNLNINVLSVALFHFL